MRVHGLRAAAKAAGRILPENSATTPASTHDDMSSDVQKIVNDLPDIINHVNVATHDVAEVGSDLPEIVNDVTLATNYVDIAPHDVGEIVSLALRTIEDVLEMVSGRFVEHPVPLRREQGTPRICRVSDSDRRMISAFPPPSSSTTKRRSAPTRRRRAGG